MIELRDYQIELSGLAEGSDNVLLQADTGAGKTAVLADIAKRHAHVLVVAHRNVLVSQLSTAFAAAGVSHGVIAASTTKRSAILQHRKMFGEEFITAGATRYICSIDTLLSRHNRGVLHIDVDLEWLIIVDEAHHMIDENKWGRLAKIFGNSRFVGATATPCRLDGNSLRKGLGGVFDRLEQASALKEGSVATLISRGFLSEFKCYAAPEIRIDYSQLVTGANDYTYKSLSQATQNQVYKMAGDAVKNYLRLAAGKQALAFCLNIDIANRTAQAFREAGISAAAIHSKLGSSESNRIYNLFQDRQIQVLFNVDMIGEGVDIPTIEALIMLRKTASLAMYRQQIGRALRPAAGKKHAIIIDHVDNIRQHGLPDEPINWSLDGAHAQGKSSLVPCPTCGFLLKAWSQECTECGENITRHVGLNRSADVAYIDYSLVEIHRSRKAKSDHRDRPASAVEITSIRHSKISGGKMADVTNKIAAWFIVQVSDSVTVGDLEDFLWRNNKLDFWVAHFVLSEIGTDKKSKCRRTFNEN